MVSLILFDDKFYFPFVGKKIHYFFVHTSCENNVKKVHMVRFWFLDRNEVY